MTVNIGKNALNSQIGSNVSNTDSRKQILGKLSSGVSLPAASEYTDSSLNKVEDSSIVSEKAANKSESQESSLDKISAMQKEVTDLDTVQTALEEVSSTLWKIGEQLSTAQQTESKTRDSDTQEQADYETTDVSVDTSQLEVEREQMQVITDKYLEGIDHTGSELLDFIEKFRESYSLDISISTENLGKTDNKNSLSSLKGDVELSSTEASDILTKAQEEVASLQISTETNRSNILNDIGNEISNFTSKIETPEVDAEFGSSIQDISELLLNNPESITDVSQINMSHAANLLLS